MLTMQMIHNEGKFKKLQNIHNDAPRQIKGAMTQYYEMLWRSDTDRNYIILR